MGEIQHRQARAAGVTDPLVLDAVMTVPREPFVPHGEDASLDAPIPIGGGQTTSQPSLIALALQHLHLDGSQRVLDVGAGSGYQTALLAHLSAQVIGLELDAGLAAAAAARLDDLGLDNVAVVVGDGWKGLPDQAPFDAIVVGAEAEEVPDALVAQLAHDGRMVIPVTGSRGADMVLVTHGEEPGDVTIRPILPVRFVPLVRST
ncbi:MAG TPA: protein-L-isoaspartate O-methyltransferase [Euzebya sp.]|nr:protein-L-isoaspartate O-methyltransferase [Euzebya sp.]